MTRDEQRESAKTAPAGASLKANNDTGERAVGEIPQEKSVTLTAGKATRIIHAYSPEFEEFWSVYPRKVEKLRAYKCWQARMREKVPPSDLIAAARHYAEKCLREGTEEKFIKHPATFLGPTRPYEDYIRPPTSQLGSAADGMHVKSFRDPVTEAILKDHEEREKRLGRRKGETNVSRNAGVPP